MTREEIIEQIIALRIKDDKDSKLERWSLENKLDGTLPIIIDGDLGEDQEQVNQDKYGREDEIYHYLGCPNTTIKRKYPNSFPITCHGIEYDRSQDITAILKANKKKYLRITIEELDIEDSKCNTCDKRFICLTI